MANRVQLEAILKFVDVQVNPGVFNQISRAAAGMPGPVQQLNKNLGQVPGYANNAANSIRGINNQLTASDKAARLFLQRMAQFAILLPTFSTLNKSIQGGVKFLFEFDAAIKDIIRVDISKLGGKFDDIAEKAFKLSDAFGSSALDAVNTIKLYTQAGFELEKATEMARLSLLATKASTLDAAGATEFLLSANKQFRLEGEALEKALDSLVAAEDLSALEAKDIAEAFKTGGNSLATFAQDINDSIGLISALREQTRKSGNEIGTFFKTLQTRIFAAGESRSAIESLGITIQNLDGSLRPTLDVLNDLKKSFDGMTQAEVANAAKAIAGTRQFESLIATINSLDNANRLSEASSNSAGAARRKEEVDSQKLSRSLDELIVAGQKLAFALGEAGASDFFKNSLKTVTSMVDAVTELVKLLDAIKVPVLPMLAPLAFKAAGSVFGFGGGGGGGKGGVGNTQDPNVIAMQQLGAESNQLAQQFRILSGAAGTQAQAQQINAAASAAQAAANKLQTDAHQQATTWYTKATGLYKNTVGSIQNSGAKFAVQYALLTVGATAITAGFNALADKLHGDGSVTGAMTKTTSAAAQMGVQFAAFGPVIAGVAAALGGLWDVSIRIKDAYNDEVKALDEMNQARMRGDSTQQGLFAISQKPNNAAQAFGKSIEGRIKSNVDYDTAFKRLFSSLDTGTKKAIGDAENLKEIYLTNSAIEYTGQLDDLGNEIVKITKGSGAELIRSLAFADDSLIQNKDAIEELRASYDASGKSSLAYKDQQDLLEQAFGRLADGAIEAKKQIEFLRMSFEDMKDLQGLIGSAQEVNNLYRDLEQHSKLPRDIVEGIDELAQTARNSQADFANAQKAFEDLLSTLQVAGADTSQSEVAGFASMNDAKEFLANLDALLSKPNNGAAISDFLSDRTLNDAQKAFATEYIKIDKDRTNAALKSKEAETALNKEISRRHIEQLKAEKDAAFTAADGLAKFQNQLLDLGVKGKVDFNLLDQITSLTSQDISGALKGSPGSKALPSAIQELIQSSFINGVKKAELDLHQIADQTANSLQPVEGAIAALNKEIQSIGNVDVDTEAGGKKEKLQRELNVKLAEKENIQREATAKALQATHTLVVESKKAQEDAAKAEADRLKKTQALTDATYEFSKSMKEVNQSFEDFVKQRFEDLGEKQATAYEAVKTAQQSVLSSTESLADTYRDYIATIIQVNGVIAEAKVKANLLGRDIGMLNGGIVTFQDKLTSLNESFTSVLNNANMSLEQRIQLETQLAEQTLSFLQQAQDEIVNAGIGVFGQSAQENQGLQKGLAGLSFIADKLGGSFQNFLSMDPQQMDQLSQELLNLPVEFRKSVLDALSFLPSTTSVGGFNVDQLKQAIGQIGAGVSDEQGLPAIADLTAQQVDQLKILGQLGTQQAKLQFTQVLTAQKQLEKAQEQLDVAQIEEERANEGFEQVRAAVADEMAVLADANLQRRELLQKVIEADNNNSLHEIEKQAQLFADQNTVFREVGNTIVQGIAQAVNAKIAMLDAKTSLSNFNTMQNFENQAKGYIPNFAAGNLSPGEAAGLLHAAAREKKAMPHGASLAVANTHEAIIPMKNFADGTAGGSAIAASINNIRTLDQTMVAAIAASVSNTLSRITTDNGSEASLDKIAGLLTELNTSINQVRDSSVAIKTNTAGLATQTTGKTPGAAAVAGQDVRITLQTNQNNTVQITGLENLRDQLKQALSETTSKQVAQQLEALMVQLEPVFQALNERGIISSFGQPR